MSRPDLEALVTPKIAEAVQAAIDKIGRGEFEVIAGINGQQLASILSISSEYVTVALVTLACQINKSHSDPITAHSSVTECLKGATIRIPSTGGNDQSTIVPRSPEKHGFRDLGSEPATTGPLYEKKTMRILGFTANVVGFLILGYFLGGIVLSPLVGESSCIGVTTSPPGLAPCGGSIIGIVVSAIGGIGYTYYYFVKKL